jgi:o-succinylbenzoate---CoA ligase
MESLILDFENREAREVLRSLPPALPPWAEVIRSVLRDYLSPQTGYKITTSGSTGTPKEIILSKKAMEESARATAAFFGAGVGTVALLCLPAEKIAGAMMVVRAAVNGWQLHCVRPRLNPMDNLTEPIDFAAFTPAQAAEIIKESPKAWRNIRKVIIGGAPVSCELERHLSQSPPECFITYGMTETITHVAARRPGETNYTTLPGIRVETDSDGKLIIRGERLGQKVVTNDIAIVCDGGSFSLRGRADNVINSGGLKLHPEEMEAAIAHLIDGEFYISSHSDGTFGERPVLVLEKKPKNPSQLLSDIAVFLGKYASPTEIQFVDTIEKTATGKVVRKRLQP